MTALARIPAFMLNWAEARGADGDALARRADVDRGSFDDLDARIPIDKIWNLWHIMIEEFPEPDLGLIMAATLDIREFGLVGYTIYYSPTLADGLHHIARYSRIVNDVLRFMVLEKADRTTLASENFPRFDMLRHPVDVRMAWALVAAREVVGSQITPIVARFPYPRPASVIEHTRLFRCEMKFDQPEAALEFRKEDVARPVVAGDPGLVRYLDQLAEQVLSSIEDNMTFADAVRREIWSDLSSGKTTVSRIASRLSTSARSLQRKLKEESTTFAAELESLRRELAQKLLKDRSLAICEVAFLLGYAEASSFYRAFHRWENVSPYEYRQAAVRAIR
jgi:AraC-like DNA-binding protein